MNVERLWYGKRCPLNWLLLPLSGLYCGIASIRRCWYQARSDRLTKPSVPLVVVGNITVGGTGKTPLVVWLCRRLQQEGYRPGIVSRGYGGKAGDNALAVTPDSDPSLVGDEPLLLARRTGCPLVICRDRPQAVAKLLEMHPCDVVISDDGLQHYAMHRDIEIGVLDGQRRFGNGFCLPAGPLRELQGRWDDLDLRVINGAEEAGCYGMFLQATELRALYGDIAEPLSAWEGKSVHALAGIGNPQRFFSMLESLGLQVERHAFADHHAFTEADFAFADARPILMTEKDAVKCRHLALKNTWYVPVDAEIDGDLGEQLLKLLENHGQ